MGHIFLAIALLAADWAVAGVHEDRSAAFCEWRSLEPQASKPHGQEFCDTYKSLPPDQLFQALEDIFRQWRQSDGDASARRAFEESYRAKAIQASADSDRKAAAAQRARFLANLPKLPEPQLCAEARRKNGMQEAVDALIRRRIFTGAEIAQIISRQITIGMRERAMLCAMGAPTRVNRTVTAISEDKQHIYGSTYIYTENGVVTAFQD